MNEDNKILPQSYSSQNDGGVNFSIDSFQQAFGVDFNDTIDIDKWNPGLDLEKFIPKIADDWLKVKARQNDNQKAIRESFFPRIKNLANVPYAGLCENISEIKDLIEKVQKGFLFNGAVTACASTIASYQTVPLTVNQVGVCLINYERQNGTYTHTLIRSPELRFENGNSFQNAVNLYKRRKSEEDGQNKERKMSDIAVRGIRAYMERLLLLERKNEKSKWILGNGEPMPHELMRGFWAGKKELSEKSLGLIKKIVEHQRFVYVQDCENFEDLWMLGDALLPFEYLVIDSIENILTQRIISGNIRQPIRDDYMNFAKEIGSKIVQGIYRVSAQAEPQIFYGHIDHIRTAALVAMADSIFQLHKGTPMLLDLASNICKISFNQNDLASTIHQASIRAEKKLRSSLDLK
jgi:hypothetical protein